MRILEGIIFITKKNDMDGKQTMSINYVTLSLIEFSNNTKTSSRQIMSL